MKSQELKSQKFSWLDIITSLDRHRVRVLIPKGGGTGQYHLYAGRYLLVETGNGPFSLSKREAVIYLTGITDHLHNFS